MAESTDDNVKNFTDALTAVAPTMAYLQYRMDNGRLHSYDIGKHVSAAIEKLSYLRNQNLKLEDYLKQQKMFDQDAPEMVELLKFFDSNKFKPAKISQFLKEIARGIEAHGEPENNALDFGEEFKKPSPAPLLEIIKSAQEKVTASKNQTSEMTIGDIKSVDAFKATFPSNAEKIATVLNKEISYKGKTMPRRELVERIAQGKAPESTLNGNVTAHLYLDFLKGNIPRAVDAIKKAKIEAAKNTGEGSVTESGDTATAYVNKSNTPETLENLKKLGRVGKLLK